MIQLTRHDHAEARARALGSDRARRQPGDRRRDLPVAGAGRGPGRRLEPDRLRPDRVAVALGRALLRGTEQPVRLDRRSLSLHARGVRRFRRLRDRLDAVVFPRHQPGEHHGGDRGRARLLLAGADRRLAARGVPGRADHGLRVDQRARRAPGLAGGQRDDRGQAGPARAVHRDRSRLRPAGQADDAAADHAAAVAGRRPPADLHLRRLRGRAGAGRRVARSTARRAVRDGRDDRVGDDRHDADADRGAGRAGRTSRITPPRSPMLQPPFSARPAPC